MVGANSEKIAKKMEISIFGCGWLGFPLGKALVKKGNKLKGSTQDLSKLALIQKNGIESYFIKLSPEISGDNFVEFFTSEILIISFPPERIDNIVEYHTKQIKSLINQIEISKIKKVIFISSTAVYPNLNREVHESDALNPEKKSGKALLIAEKLFVKNPNFETTVLRFGGLIGENRNPANFLKRKKNSPNLNAPLNLIHIDDCIRIIIKIIEKGKWAETYNASCPEHPLRSEFYSIAAKLSGIEYSLKDTDISSKYKIVNSNKLIKEIDYKFIYSNPLQVFSVQTGFNKFKNQ